MIYLDLKAAYPRKCMRKLLLKILLVIGIFPAKMLTYHPLFILILNHMHASENNDAVYVERPLAFFAESLIINAVTDLIVKL